MSRRQARRVELLATAIEAIREKGPDCSIDDIARRVGVSRPIIYRFFDSRDGLAHAVGAETAQRVRERMFAAMSRQSEPRAVVAAAIGAYLQFIEDDPQLYRYLLHGPLGEHTVVGAAGGDFVGRLGREIAVVLGDVLEANGHDTGMAEPWAIGIIGMVGATGEWWQSRGALSRRRLTEYLTRLVWDGLGTSVAPMSAASPADELSSRRRSRPDPQELSS